MGYWEPHTAVIDFCEENYRFTFYVAEPLNALSSLPIAAIGAWGWALTPSVYRRRPRFVLCWLGFVTVGLGSAAFHATLRRPAQALDEIPMVLTNLVFVFCLSCPEEEERSSRLIASLSLSGLVLVAVYILFEAYAVFFVMYGVVVLYLFIQSGWLAFNEARSTIKLLLRHLWLVGVGTYGSGFVLWVADNTMCFHLGVGHLHIAWHALAGVGTMLFVLLLIAITADKEGMQVSLRMHQRVMPCLIVHESKAD